MSLTGWNPNQKIAITVPAQPSTLTDFPLLVNLTAASGVTGFDCSDVFTKLGANSLKIAVEYGDTGNQCPVEIEFWDDINGKAVLHTKIPSVSATVDTVINFYYDEAQADNTTYVGNTGDAIAQTVWDANFVAVYHMAQDPSGTAPQILDSTINANHGTAYGTMTSGDLIDGLTGKAIGFDGVDDYVDCGNTLSLQVTTNFTVEAMFLPASVSSIQSIVGKYVHDTTYAGWGLQVNDDASAICGFRKTSTDYIKYTTSTALFSIGNWSTAQLSYVGDGTTPTYYIDGITDSLSVFFSSGDALSGILDSGGVMKIAATPLFLSSGDYFLSGAVAEIRISSIVRSADWIAATNLSLRDTLIALSLPVTGSVIVYGNLIQLYDLPVYIISQYISQLYAIAFPLHTTVEQVYGLRMLVALSQHYGDSPVLLQRLLQYYGDSEQLRKAIVQLYEDALQIHNIIDQPYIYPDALQSILEQKYSISATELQAISDHPYSIRSVALASASIVQPFSILYGGGRLLSYTVTVDIAGYSLDFTGLSIEASRDAYCLSCDIVLASQSDYMLCVIGEDIVVTIDGTAFVFFIEARQRQRGHATAEYTISCLSKTALLDAPYSDTVTPASGYLAGMASQIVSDLASGCTIDWQTVDWYIPANTLLPSDQTPLAIIRQIAAAAGALIQTEPDGTMTVEPAYPAALPSWPTVTAYYTLSDAMDIFTTGETFYHRTGYNRYLISDQLTSDTTLRLEEEAIAVDRKYIRAYQTPWRDDFDLSHTGGDWVSIEPLGIDERLIEDELVEFVSGTGRTGYPIYERVAIEWLQEPLGTVTFGEDGALLADIEGESLLRISYRTKCRKYLVTDRKIEPLQLVAEEA